MTDSEAISNGRHGRPHAPRGAGIELVDLHYSVKGRKILSGLQLSIPHGKITAVMGPSGTGKTTLLRLMTGQVHPDRGRVLVENQNLAGLSARDLYRVRRHMGFLFQQSALFSDLTVFENVAFALREHTDLPEALVRIIVLTKLHAVGLRGAGDLLPGELSGGMARRVALARAIVLDPSILFCDEPFVGLDPISCGVVLRLLKVLNEALGMSIVVVSHDVHEAQALAHNNLIVIDGRVAAYGTPRELRDHPAAGVQQFLHGSADGPVPYHYPATDYYQQLVGRDIRLAIGFPRSTSKRG